MVAAESVYDVSYRHLIVHKATLCPRSLPTAVKRGQGGSRPVFGSSVTTSQPSLKPYKKTKNKNKKQKKLRFLLTGHRRPMKHFVVSPVKQFRSSLACHRIRLLQKHFLKARYRPATKNYSLPYLLARSVLNSLIFMLDV